MLYVGIDHHKRYAQLNAIDEKGSHPCFGGPRPNGQDIPRENGYNTSWNPKGKGTQNSKRASLSRFWFQNTPENSAGFRPISNYFRPPTRLPRGKLGTFIPGLTSGAFRVCG